MNWRYFKEFACNIKVHFYQDTPLCTCVASCCKVQKVELSISVGESWEAWWKLSGNGMIEWSANISQELLAKKCFLAYPNDWSRCKAGCGLFQGSGTWSPFCATCITLLSITLECSGHEWHANTATITSATMLCLLSAFWIKTMTELVYCTS